MTSPDYVPKKQSRDQIETKRRILMDLSTCGFSMQDLMGIIELYNQNHPEWMAYVNYDDRPICLVADRRITP